jgi:hypothetical protein
MNYVRLLLRAILLLLVSPQWSVACAKSPQCTSREVPRFESAVPSTFVLEELKRMSGRSTLTAVASNAPVTTGYAFALPGSEAPEGESLVVTIDYSARHRETVGTSCSESRSAPPAAQSCIVNVRSMPFSAGPGGSSRGLEFTTFDMGYDVRVSVFEKLENTNATRPIDLDRFAAIIAEKYCSADRNTGK